MGGLPLKFIAHPFYGCDAVHIQLLPDFSYVYIDGAVANNDVTTPNLR
jgi:hypothetical protein